MVAVNVLGDADGKHIDSCRFQAGRLRLGRFDVEVGQAIGEKDNDLAGAWSVSDAIVQLSPSESESGRSVCVPACVFDFLQGVLYAAMTRTNQLYWSSRQI